MINAEAILQEVYPELSSAKTGKFVIKLLKNLLHEADFNDFISTHQHLRGFAFLEKLLQHFEFDYEVSSDSYQNIPAVGRLLIVANHPIGTLDGLALVKLIKAVRPDVRIIANQVLQHMTPLQSIFLPVDILSGKKAQKQSYQAMLEALENEEAVIIFPAGEVSRISPKGVRDGEWQTGFIKLAKKAHCPILPIHIEAYNSMWFYGASMLYKPLGTMLLVNEMFNKHKQSAKFRVGAPIAFQSLEKCDETKQQLAKRMRKHVINLGKHKKSLFKTYATVAHPVDTKALKKALYQSQVLGETRDGKKIFLYHYRDDCPVMQEIGRLRELTFRTVEEGTGLAQDIDKYDVYYEHLILWDEYDLEIVGAYRIGAGNQIMASHGSQGFYSQSLFEFTPAFEALLPNSIELGRSFVQPRYWGQRSLDYLWYGIGAYIRLQPQVKYLFGPLSLSNAYPQLAKETIVGFYAKQFGSSEQFVHAKQPFELSEATRTMVDTTFNSDYKSSFKLLTTELQKLGVKVPTLYKQYVDLCVEEGCHFMGFNVDPDFNDCIDSLVMIELDKITPKKRQRYIENIEDN